MLLKDTNCMERLPIYITQIVQSNAHLHFQFAKILDSQETWPWNIFELFSCLHMYVHLLDTCCECVVLNYAKCQMVIKWKCFLFCRKGLSGTLWSVLL